MCCNEVAKWCPSIFQPGARGSQKEAGSIPDEVTGFFNLPNPSSRTVSLGVHSATYPMGTWG
jgi:hypothetical protein